MMDKEIYLTIIFVNYEQKINVVLKSIDYTTIKNQFLILFMV